MESLFTFISGSLALAASLWNAQGVLNGLVDVSEGRWRLRFVLRQLLQFISCLFLVRALTEVAWIGHRFEKLWFVFLLLITTAWPLLTAFIQDFRAKKTNPISSTVKPRESINNSMRKQRRTKSGTSRS